MTSLSDSIVLGCWILVSVYWLVTAFGQKAPAERQSWVAILAHRIPVGLGWALLACPQLPPPMNLVLFPRTAATRIIGAAVCGFGFCVTIWARRTLGSNWSSSVTFKQSHELIRTGPYRFARHPIYTGLLVMCLGTAFEMAKFRGVLSFVSVGAGFWIKIKQEERLLLRHFPDQYPAYQKQVKAVVPFVL